MASSIRFDERTDPHLIRRIQAERQRRGLPTVAKAARDLLNERLLQIESADAASPRGHGKADRADSIPSTQPTDRHDSHRADSNASPGE